MSTRPTTAGGKRSQIWLWLGAIAITIGTGTGLLAQDGEPPRTADATADSSLKALLREDVAPRAAVIQQLRKLGQPGLDRVFALHADLQKRCLAEPEDQALAASLTLVGQAIDSVGGAKYCQSSGLFWYHDFEQAKAAARASGKPILALRMLGNLTDDLSCANSRFFRTTLYSNRQVSQYLRDNFILSWKSVREVPKITIDLGGGRKIERTITGNSIHYVLDADGMVIDGIPGLYGPAAFLDQLARINYWTTLLARTPAADRPLALRTLHRQQLADLAQRWQADFDAVAAQVNDTMPVVNPQRAAFFADLARRLASHPGDPEWPERPEIMAKFAALEAQMTDEVWSHIANLRSDQAKLDDTSRQLVGAMRPTAVRAGRLAISKRVVEDPMLALVRNLEGSMALDTVKNEYQLHRQLHLMLAAAETRHKEVEVVNRAVYESLFLMPLDDPWLGLAPADTFSALPNNGLVVGPR